MFDFLSLPTSFLFAMVIEGLWALVLLYLWRLLKDGPYLLFFALQSASLFVFHLIATFELADPLANMVVTNGVQAIFLTIGIWLFTHHPVRPIGLGAIAVICLLPAYALKGAGVSEPWLTQAPILSSGMVGLYLAWLMVRYCRKEKIAGYQLLAVVWILSAIHSLDFAPIMLSGNRELLISGFLFQSVLSFSAMFGMTILIYGRVYAQLTRANETLAVQASTDALTGLGNRSSFILQGQTAFETARLFDHPFSLIIIYLDHFKAVNDTYGHAAGDEVLRIAGQTLQDHSRGADCVGRLGGEEFAIFLPETDEEGAVSLAEKIRIALSNINPPHSADGEPVTASFGVAALAPQTVSLENLMANADIALYQSKAAGRNRVSTFT